MKLYDCYWFRLIFIIILLIHFCYSTACLYPAFDSIFTPATCPGNVCQNLAIDGSPNITFTRATYSTQTYLGMTLNRYRTGTLNDPSFSIRDAHPAYISFITHMPPTNNVVITITHCNLIFTFASRTITVTDGIVSKSTINTAYSTSNNPSVFTFVIAAQLTTSPLLEIWYNNIIVASWSDFRISLSDVLATYSQNYYYKTAIFLDRLTEEFIRNSIIAGGSGVSGLTTAFCRELPDDDSMIYQLLYGLNTTAYELHAELMSSIALLTENLGLMNVMIGNLSDLIVAKYEATAQYVSELNFTITVILNETGTPMLPPDILSNLTLFIDRMDSAVLSVIPMTMEGLNITRLNILNDTENEQSTVLVDTIILNINELDSAISMGFNTTSILCSTALDSVASRILVWYTSWYNMVTTESQNTSAYFITTFVLLGVLVGVGSTGLLGILYIIIKNCMNAWDSRKFSLL